VSGVQRNWIWFARCQYLPVDGCYFNGQADSTFEKRIGLPWTRSTFFQCAASFMHASKQLPFFNPSWLKLRSWIRRGWLWGVWEETERQTDRQTDRHTHRYRQTEGHEQTANSFQQTETVVVKHVRGKDWSWSWKRKQEQFDIGGSIVNRWNVIQKVEEVGSHCRKRWSNRRICCEKKSMQIVWLMRWGTHDVIMIISWRIKTLTLTLWSMLKYDEWQVIIYT